MRMIVRGRAVALGIGLSLVVLAVGCGGDDKPAATSTSPAVATSTSQGATAQGATATARPATPTAMAPAQPSGTFTLAKSDIAFPAMVPSLLPVTPGGFLERWGVYETLTVFAAGSPEIENRLITNWEMDADGLGWTLDLKKGVQFHGGWGEMTAEDFVWSFQDEISEDSIHSSIGLARAAGAVATVVDSHTVSMRLDSPNSFFFAAYFANAGGAATKVFSKNRFETLGSDAALQDISGGTGPFTFEKWNQGEEVALQAFDDYHGELSRVKTVNILEIKEPATQIAALKSGQVDATLVPAPLAADVARESKLGIRSVGLPGSQRVYPQGQFCMSTTLAGDPVEPYPRPGYDPSKPWIGECDNDVSQENARKVRMAMAMAIDRQSIVDNILGGFGRPSYLPEVGPPLLDRVWQDKWTIPYDVAGAKALLTEAGYPNGIDALVRITTGSHPLEVEMGQAVVQFLGALGGMVTTEVLTYTGNRPGVVAREQGDLWFRSSGAGGADPPELVMLRRNPENAFNPGVEVREPLEIISQMDSITNQDELDAIREDLYDKYNFNQWIIPVVLADQIMGINTDKVLDWQMSSGSGDLGDFENIRLK